MQRFKFPSILVLTLALMFGFVCFTMANQLDGDPMADPPEADALNRDDSGAPWITNWWMLDGQITDNGGFAVSGPTDWLSEGSGGAITQESISTMAGLLASKGSTISLPAHGGDLSWTAVTIDSADGNNMSTVYGLADESNFDTYAIIVIDSPNARTTTMSPAHDDYAQIWVNGTKCYNNSRWTGATEQVDYDIGLDLNKGLNVLLYRCGESGGSDYFNLHFADSDSDLTTYPDDNGVFFDAFEGRTAVEAAGKLSTTWGDIKKQR